MNKEKLILILKCGMTYKNLQPEFGDFDDWIIEGMGAQKEDCSVVDVYKNQKLPVHEKIAAVVITGAHSMITDKTGWLENSIGWVRQAVEEKVPVLGICFGHQLLGLSLGGKVGFNPNGLEYGTVPIKCAANKKHDPLFQDFPRRFKAHVCHAQAILQMPSGATRLASSELDPNQILAYGDNAWGVQFHPEFSVPVAREYIRQDERPLRRHGKNVEKMIAEVESTPHSAEILKKFHARATKTE
ncbi:MAG: glutamine amidotransferase [Calditrichaeota bacterium]|nr:MAG: glutamine amidotransferase [Calditrichota bacterium]